MHVPTAQHDQQHQMRCRAEPRDTDFLAAKMLRTFQLTAGHDSLHAFVDDGADHDHIRPAETRVDHAATPTAEKLHVSGD